MNLKFGDFVIIFLNIFCIILIIQIEFEIIAFNPLNMGMSAIRKLNNLILIFSSGFILSSIFNLLVNYIPTRNKAKITKAIIDKYLISLVQETSDLITYITKRNNFDIQKINTESIEFIENFPSDLNVEVHYLYNIESTIKMGYSLNTNEFDFLKDKVDRIYKASENILQLPFIDLINFEIIKVISSFRTSEYLEIIANEVERYIPKPGEVDIRLSMAFAEPFIEFFNLYKKLLKFESTIKYKIENVEIT